MLYTHSIENQPYNTMMVFKMRDSVPSRDIPAFVMYCVYGASRSYLFQGRSYRSGWSGYGLTTFCANYDKLCTYSYLLFSP